MAGQRDRVLETPSVARRSESEIPSNRQVSWHDHLVRLVLVLLVLAFVFGIAAGVVPGMRSLENTLFRITLRIYILAMALSLPCLLLVIWDFRHRLWGQGARHLIAFVGPVIVFIGADGFSHASHALWWEPISNIERSHLFHNPTVAGAPLTLLYWLALRRWWRPASKQEALPVSRRFVISSVTVVVGFLVFFSWLIQRVHG